MHKWFRSFLILAILISSFASFHSIAKAQIPASGSFIPGQVVIILKSGSRINSLNLPTGISLASSSAELDILHAAIMNVPKGQEQVYVQKMENTPGVQLAEPNYLVKTEAVIPNDPFWTQQYGPSHIQAPDAWSITTGSEDVKLAVIDSGIYADHPEFAGRLIPGYDFVENDTVPQDECGHGTHVAGIAAATGNNGIGIAGMAWKVKIMPVRVLDGYCSGTTVDVAEGLVWAADRGAQVINLSLGTSSPSTLLEDGTYYAYTHGAAIFAAAGNSGGSPVVYPAAYPWVMAIGATDQNDQRASYSNTGAGLDLMAPGSDILSTTPFGDFFYKDVLNVSPRYGTLSGTSMATAFASGSAALLASLQKFNAPDKIYQALTKTALDLDLPGRDDKTGYGLIQVFNALNFSPSIVPTPTPLPSAISYDIQDSKTCANLVQYHWQDATVGTLLPIFGDDSSTTISMPFTFRFGGKDYDNVTVSANGYFTFGGDGSIAENFIIPSIAQPNNFIAPFWDDLNPGEGGSIIQADFGDAPNRQFVVEWFQVPRAGFTSSDSQLTFEIILFESSNQILFQYQKLSGEGSDGSSATIGVEYMDGAAGKEYSYNKAGAVSEGLALLILPFSTGDPSPSNNCSTYTRTVDSNGGFFDQRPFCVDIPAGEIQTPATLKIQNLDAAPPIPPELVNLDHFADISLAISPPIPLSPIPLVYICYHFTASDVFKAGGHSKNLSLAAYDDVKKTWTVLPTKVNDSQSLLTAVAPHLSIYTVVTTHAPSKLPVTGTSFRFPLVILLVIPICLAGFFLPFAWRRRRKSHRSV